MSLFDFQAALKLADDVSFDALIMAAALRADTINRRLLHSAFPALAVEAYDRREAPGGRLPEDGPRG
ncbi:hypothetical protein [Frankia sp. R82]|uniref:hypothetical protein n=1 Tax=Frankia sp. R82 TaxID=2950553 RepID=UPI002043C329|nr:hypothetical protein [Frankia sp. R82]MCM3884137.1 hypothetical protein [Frankia sp. R82]